MTTRTLLVLAITATACGSPARTAVRFANAPPVTAVDDRLDVPKRPDSRVFMPTVWHYDGLFQRRITRAMELRRDRRALGVNALDEVPDSTWFTNRIGVRALEPDEIRNGPGGDGSPELHRPWTIRSTKVGGASVGFIVTDARGKRFLLKFDWNGFPEVETGAHVIVNRLLWACGYNVPEDYVVNFDRSDLRLAPDAVIKDIFGGERKLTENELDLRFAQIDRGPDGRYRGMASRWLDGKTLGGHPAEGVRDDDPNDVIPHELRRDLRGAYPIFAWLDHTDVQEGNFLDAWVTDPDNPKRHFVRHYLIDFGKALGVMSTTSKDPRHGHEYVFDLEELARSTITLGTRERNWEDREQPTLRGVGAFSIADYDPGAWKPDSSAYVPFLVSDRIDKFWGAKIVARFTRAQLRAAVDAARFTDPRAVDYITDTLVARQRATAAYWFTQVNPLDRFAIARDGALCFDDLAIVHGFAPAPPTRYAVALVDFDGHPTTGTRSIAPDTLGRACTAPLALASGHDRYTIVEITTSRPGFTGTTHVHLAADPGGMPRVIGIWRP